MTQENLEKAVALHKERAFIGRLLEKLEAKHRVSIGSMYFEKDFLSEQRVRDAINKELNYRLYEINKEIEQL